MDGLTWILLIIIAYGVLRMIGFILEDLFYTPPKMPPIKTYYTDKMLQEVHLDD